MVCSTTIQTVMTMMPLSKYSTIQYDEDCNGIAEQTGTAIENVENIAFVNLYPNPTGNLIHLNLSLNESTNLTINVISAIGQTIEKKIFD